MHFTKLHGLGNDFILFDGRALPDYDWNAAALPLCDRRSGIGADGLLILLDSERADMRMRIVNADGSEAEMCGNGVRCFAKYAFETGAHPKPHMRIETLAGIIKPEVLTENGQVTGVRVDMGEPFLDCKDIPVEGEGRCIGRELTVLGKTLTVTSVLVGVPHTIVFVDTLGELDIASVGPAIENAPMFPRRTNVDFVRVINDHHVEMRTWERGCGQTLCCGTGASSVAVACALNHKTARGIDVAVELGTLHIDWADDNHVYMTGPAETVFAGEVALP